MDQECSVVLSKLVTSKQHVDDIEKEVMAKSKENLFNKQLIQELAGFAEGSIVGVPEHWTLEEQHTALRLVLRAIEEEATGEEVSLIDLEDKDLTTIVQLTYEENEMLGRQASSLGRKVVELTGIIAGMTENKGEDHECLIEVEYTEKQQEDYASNEHERSVVNGHNSSISDLQDDMMKVDKNGNYVLRPGLETMKGLLLVKSSKAKLKKFNCCSSLTKSSTLLAVSSNNAVLKLPKEEIRHTKAGHDPSKDDQLMSEEMSSKYGCETGIDEKIQPCQVVLTGLGWGGLSPDLVENDARKYEGVTQVRIEGDTAVVEFRNAELASRFRGQGGYHVIEGYALEVGEVVVGQGSLLANGGYAEEVDDHSKDNTEASKVDKDLLTSVAVRVKRRRGQS